MKVIEVACVTQCVDVVYVGSCCVNVGVLLMPEKLEVSLDIMTAKSVL